MIGDEVGDRHAGHYASAADCTEAMARHTGRDHPALVTGGLIFDGKRPVPARPESKYLLCLSPST